MLKNFDIEAMVPVKDLDEAKKFYGETLGLEVLKDSPAGVLYKSGGTKLFVYPTPMAGTNKATTATWEVTNIKQVVEELKAKGVSQWEHYEYPGAEYDGEVHLMGGAKAAWFKDPTGNILGLSEM